ncbi:MAG: Stage 0 sporulation protein J [Candidatus Moranbacteria bacterium GW2011_GWE2_35_2-]|nr:MAG: Stage 0 sporulation protein J [Candidatus Moranbacteria bacterium GW2011_GWE2_35_2-]KKQ06301.1 MAG: Stage 0 sporulation protein J [Candidatus Moranbacteria bacterium GW2011_GWF1_36_4]KKQ22299.1 MAG: Stage 0 sporulation protein J [Candidatus Moranbacteria bacterium GW2011_GWF2_37_11]KKQ28527.1 MAG: Stage 0 sporulation protein J [Candidatus Moranbacteria bacterium GW2011_GWD1_37_17]KKQ30209.1 MAG: Stage 0 sporulation protein J [Candidatus Moranbacteria bacterium GW2011_GWE1_37_24]HBO1638
MAQEYGLGRGLASLIPQKNKKSEDEGDVSLNTDFSQRGDRSDRESDADDYYPNEVEIDRIKANPYQPRTDFDQEKLEELSKSIKNHGIIQPLVVSRQGNGFELIAGERRFQAAKLAGFKKVPVVVRQIDDKQKLEMAIIENVQRHNLNPIEEARAYQRLADEFQMNQEDVAQRMGKNRSTVANKLRLLQLPIQAQKALISGQISEGHAKALLAVDSAEKQLMLLEMILKNNLTVRQSESKSKEVSVKTHSRKITVDPEVKDLENRLAGFFGTKVKIKKSGDSGGKITIEYYSDEELDGILEKVI